MSTHAALGTCVSSVPLVIPTWNPQAIVALNLSQSFIESNRDYSIACDYGLIGSNLIISDYENYLIDNTLINI